MFLRVGLYTYVMYDVVCTNCNSVLNTIGRSFTLFRLPDCEFAMCARCVYRFNDIYIDLKLGVCRRRYYTGRVPHALTVH